MWKAVETAPQHTKENDMRQIKITFVALLLAIATALPTMAGNEPAKHPDTLTTEYRNTQYIDTIRNLNINVDYPTVANGKLKVSVLRYEAETLANTAQMLSLSYDAKAKAYDGDSINFPAMLRFYTTLLTDRMNEADKANGTETPPSGTDLKILRSDDDTRYVTFSVSGYIYSGGAHGQSINRGVTFDKTTGERAVLVNDSEALRKLILTKLPEEVGAFLDDSLPPMPANPAFLKDGQVMLVYETGEIAPNATGAITVAFWPYEIEDYLTAEGKRLTEVR